MSSEKRSATISTPRPDRSYVPLGAGNTSGNLCVLELGRILEGDASSVVMTCYWDVEGEQCWLGQTLGLHGCDTFRRELWWQCPDTSRHVAC